MGLFNYTIAGGGFILIGAWESFVSSSSTSLTSNPSSFSPPSISPKGSSSSSSSVVTFGAIFVLSLLFIINSLISLSDAITSKDRIGFAFQLQVISIALLFFLYSNLGLSMHINKNWARSPKEIVNVLSLFAFGQEFIFFYVRRKDPNGVGNRYYDLFLVPIGICVFSTILELKNGLNSNYYARLARGIGIISQGMWILQMGFSFFSELMVEGCSLQQKSRGNYTIRCKGHPEYHRGRAIATLQFNIHLALLVSLIVGVYAIVCKINGVGRESAWYRPLGAEMQHNMESRTQFTLDDDDDLDDGDGENGIREEKNVEMQQKAIVSVSRSGANGTHR